MIATPGPDCVYLRLFSVDGIRKHSSALVTWGGSAGVCVCAYRFSECAQHMGARGFGWLRWRRAHPSSSLSVVAHGEGDDVK